MQKDSGSMRNWSATFLSAPMIGRKDHEGIPYPPSKAEMSLIEMRKRIALANKSGVFDMEGAATDGVLSKKLLLICDLHADLEAMVDILMRKLFVVSGRSFGMKTTTETLCGEHEFSLHIMPTKLMKGFGLGRGQWSMENDPEDNAAAFAAFCARIATQRGNKAEVSVMQTMFSVTDVKRMAVSRKENNKGRTERAFTTMFVGGRHVIERNGLTRHANHIRSQSYTIDGLYGMAASNCDDIQMLGERVLDEWVVGTSIEVYMTNLIAQAAVMYQRVAQVQQALVKRIWQRIETKRRITQKNAYATEEETVAFGSGVYVYHGFPVMRIVRIGDISDVNLYEINKANSTKLNAITLTPVRHQFRVIPDTPMRLVGDTDTEWASKGRKAFIAAGLDAPFRVSSTLPYKKEFKEVTPKVAPVASVPLFKV